jgi:ATP-dependent Clp protease ATP-binding subunit ClpA
MFERFAEPARKAVVLAVTEATRRGDRRVGTDHLLLGVLHDADVAKIIGADADTARNAADALDRDALAAVGLGVGGFTPSGVVSGSAHPSFSSGSKAVMKRMLEHATAERARRIAPKHLALALLDRPEPDPAAALLASLGVDRHQARDRLRTL